MQFNYSENLSLNLHEKKILEELGEGGFTLLFVYQLLNSLYPGGVSSHDISIIAQLQEQLDEIKDQYHVSKECLDWLFKLFSRTELKIAPQSARLFKYIESKIISELTKLACGK